MQNKELVTGVSALQKEEHQILERLSIIEKEKEELEKSSSLLGFTIETFRKGLREEEFKYLGKLN